jgi:AhpD family alkylhydroperoxidase
MLLDERMLRLIALGASICANCQPCLQTNLTKALESGASELEIAQAIWVGRQVRHGAAAGMDQFAASMNQAIPLSESLPDGGCSCS